MLCQCLLCPVMVLRVHSSTLPSFINCSRFYCYHLCMLGNVDEYCSWYAVHVKIFVERFVNSSK